jgi:xanthine/CO dehydrogenase XdhC/CoxF family maturation factor
MPHYGTDREILETAISWLKQDHRLVLVTVVRTWGSSPRPIGSLMLMREDGLHVGSVSGGCVEEDLVARYRDQQLAALTRLSLITALIDRNPHALVYPAAVDWNSWLRSWTIRPRSKPC